MSAVLRTVVLSLAAVVVLLNGTIVIARVVLIRRQKQQRRLRPRAETLIADYLADPSAKPPWNIKAFPLLPWCSPRPWPAAWP